MVVWIELVWLRKGVGWRAVVNAAMNLPVP